MQTSARESPKSQTNEPMIAIYIYMRKHSFRRTSLNVQQTLSPEPHKAELSPLRETAQREGLRRTQTNLLPGRKPAFELPGEKPSALPFIQALSPSGSLPSFDPRRRSRILSPSAVQPPHAGKPQYSIKVIPVEERQVNGASPAGRRFRRGQSQEPIESKPDRGVRNFAGSHLADTYLALEKANALPRPSETMLNSLRIRLPAPRRPQTIVLDLEETLVHICEHKASAELILRTSFSPPIEVPINVRPYAQKCLCALHKNWEVVVFASSPRTKVEAVLDYLDPERTMIDVRLYQEDCLQIQGVLVKDLRLLSGRDLKRTVIVDNTASCFAFQIDNGIPIKTWRNNQHDRELMNLLSFTEELAAETDVRIKLKSTFDLKHFCADFAKVFKITQPSSRPQG